MSSDKELSNEYQVERNKLGPLLNADSDFIALENAYNNLNEKRKLEIANKLIEKWRERCLHAESMLTEKQRNIHMSLYFDPKGDNALAVNLENIIIKDGIF